MLWDSDLPHHLLWQVDLVELRAADSPLSPIYRASILVASFYKLVPYQPLHNSYILLQGRTTYRDTRSGNERPRCVCKVRVRPCQTSGLLTSCVIESRLKRNIVGGGDHDVPFYLHTTRPNWKVSTSMNCMTAAYVMNPS